MKFNFKGNLIAFLLLSVLFLGIGIVSASENVTDIADVQQDIESDDVVPDIASNTYEIQSNEQAALKNTSITSNNPSMYYKENGQLIGYLKDNDNKPIKNKNLTISLNGKTYSKTTDKVGKIVLNLNLKPNRYDANIKFDGDANYSSSYYNAVIKVFKAPLSIQTNNFNTYWKSDLYFKAKVLNKVTKKPVSGIKVLFKVYSGKKLYGQYYATTNGKGIAYLNKNLRVGTYAVHVFVSDAKQKKQVVIDSSKSKATLKVKPTAEMGCCSIYLQVSSSESLTGFRRDSTYSADIHIKSVNWYGRVAVKQYKTNGGYSFHSVTTADGWMLATGGADGPNVNRDIEKLAGEMVKSKSIQSSKLRKIRSLISSLGFSIGHFAIKAPNGKYALVWTEGFKTGKLNPGQYISVPNSRDCFREGNWKSFGGNPIGAAVKILASDPYGVNRRDVTVFYWKATTKEGSTTSWVKVYAANDNGNAVGAGTAYLKDNIYFKDKFFSKNSLPSTPSKKILGYHNFGKINKYKVLTSVNAPIVTASVNNSKWFTVTIKNRATNAPLNAISIKLKIATGSKYRTYSLKLNNGVAKLNTKVLSAGNHRVYIYSANYNYYISKVSKIVINK